MCFLMTFFVRFSDVSWLCVVLTSHVAPLCSTCSLRSGRAQGKRRHARADCSGQREARDFVLWVWVGGRWERGGENRDRSTDRPTWPLTSGGDGVRGVRYRGGVRGFRMRGCRRVAHAAGGGSGLDSGACGVAAQVSDGKGVWGQQMMISWAKLSR